MEIIRNNTCVSDTTSIPNAEPFKCPVCFEMVTEHAGIVLKNCSHKFCRECMTDIIQYSAEPNIACPFLCDDNCRCAIYLSESEVKELLGDLYEEHLQKSLNWAEIRIENSCHCKTTNCDGWVINEDNLTSFNCPVCMQFNCLSCQVIKNIYMNSVMVLVLVSICK